MNEEPLPEQGAPPVAPMETKQRFTQEELTVESVRRQEHSRPPPKNEYLYREEMLPPPDEYHFEEKRTDMMATAPESMDSRKSEMKDFLLLFGLVLKVVVSTPVKEHSGFFRVILESQASHGIS